MFRLMPLLLAIAFLCSASVAFANGSPPKDVAPIRSGELELRVPHGQMGCIEAWDTSSKQLVWRRQIYAVRYDVELERDVQDVFIEAIELQKSKLLVKNERGSAYELDLDSLQVTPVKGPLVEGKKR